MNDTTFIEINLNMSVMENYEGGCCHIKCYENIALFNNINIRYFMVNVL
jgi:hypothetical protein